MGNNEPNGKDFEKQKLHDSKKVHKRKPKIRGATMINHVLTNKDINAIGVFLGATVSGSGSTLLSNVRFDKEAVYVGDFIRHETHNPRLTFALILQVIRDLGVEKRVLNFNVVYPKYVKVGEGCTIGGEGFGYERDTNGNPIHIPHFGQVIIGEHVHIHNQVNIDRGVLSDTIIGEHTKIDSFVHIAHGAKIGKRCLITSHAVIAGSCVIGDDVYIGIGAQIRNKVKIGNGAFIGMGAVVTKDVEDGATVIGNPAKPMAK